MQNLNSIPIVGKFTDAASAANTNFAAVKLAIDQLELTKSRSKGFFTSALALTSKYPSPVVGDWAIVQVTENDVTQNIIYKCSTAGSWSSTGIAWEGGSIDLSQYAQLTDVPECGYYICNTGASAAAKTVSATGYHLKIGGNVRILMSNANTANSPTLNIGSTGAKPLYYNGAVASSSNSWEAGEVIVVYYDGSNYKATNSHGGDGAFESGEKVSEVSIVNTPISGSSDLVDGDGIYKNCASFMTSADSVDLNIIDENNKILAEFAEGHFRTKEFDSRQAATLTDVANVQHPVDTNTINDGDYAVCDENGNQILRCYDGHIKTKNFDSKNAATIQDVEAVSKKRTIKALFIGNSVNQDHIMYVPWYLKSTYGDDIDFKIGCYYIASYTIKKYVEDVITGNKNADYWSTAENTITWTNVQNTPLLTALQSDDWDIISMEGYFNNDYSQTGYQEDMSYFPTLVDWFVDNANVPFRLGFLMHQTYKGSQVFGDIIQGTKDAIDDNPATLVFPCGLATEYAKEFLSQSFLTSDDIHNQEGLPCALGGFVAGDILARLIGLPSKLLANPNRVTQAIHTQMNVVGQNGTFQAGTETQWKQCHIAATKAMSAGRGLQSIAEQEMINALNS